MRPRGNKPPDQPVYDIDATAFRRFFELPDDEWKWLFDVPGFDVRFVALDLNQISDLGTTWQACHSFRKDSEQFRWYDRRMADRSRKFVVTHYNERNGAMGAQKRAWHRMFRNGTIVITGFGYYAERAEVDGFTCYNTLLSGKGNQYPTRRRTCQFDLWLGLGLRCVSHTPTSASPVIAAAVAIDGGRARRLEMCITTFQVFKFAVKNRSKNDHYRLERKLWRPKVNARCWADLIITRLGPRRTNTGGRTS